MPTRFRATGLVIALGVGLLVAPPATAAAHTAQQPPAELAPTPIASVDWRRCRSGLLRSFGARCGNIRVPLDFTRPGGRTITLALSRIAHTSSAARYQGVLLLNPGGPGVRGRSMSVVGQSLPRSVRSRYDWIGFDPRGVGASRPAVTCRGGHFDTGRPDYRVGSRSELLRWKDRSRRWAHSCRQRNGPILRHLTTVANAHDLERLRIALGVERINYYGFSYGTYLGQVYATLYPDRVRRLVLDSNVDPHTAFYESNLDQNIAFQRVFERWFRWIGQRSGRYHLGHDRRHVEDAFTTAARDLAHRPVGDLGPNEWTDAFGPVGYSRSAWRSAAGVFSGWVRHSRARPVLRMARANRTGNNTFAMYNAVQCTDALWPSRWSDWMQDARRNEQRAPLITWSNLWFNAPCHWWRPRADGRFRVNGAAAPAALLLSERLDGATPFSGNLTVRRLFPRSTLVVVPGGTTHANSLGNRCLRRHVIRYLRDGVTVTRRPGRQPDARC